MIFALVEPDFVTGVLLNFPDELVSDSDELLRTFRFHPVTTNCAPTSDEKSVRTAERPKMTI